MSRLATDYGLRNCLLPCHLKTLQFKQQQQQKQQRQQQQQQNVGNQPYPGKEA